MSSSKLLISDLKSLVLDIRHVQTLFKQNVLHSLRGSQSGGGSVFEDTLNSELAKLNGVLQRGKRKGRDVMDQVRSLRTSLQEELQRGSYHPGITSLKVKQSSDWRRANKFWAVEDADNDIKENTNTLELIKRLESAPGFNEGNTDLFTKRKQDAEAELSVLYPLRAQLSKAKRTQEKLKLTRAGYKDVDLYARNLKAKHAKQKLRVKYQARLGVYKLRQREIGKNLLEKETGKLKKDAGVRRAIKRYEKWTKNFNKASDDKWDAQDGPDLRKALISGYVAQDGRTAAVVDLTNNMPAGYSSIDDLRTSINNINKLYMLDEPITPPAPPAPLPATKKKVILKRKRPTQARPAPTPPPPPITPSNISSSVYQNTRSRAKTKPTVQKLKKRRRR